MSQTLRIAAMAAVAAWLLTSSTAFGQGMTDLGAFGQTTLNEGLPTLGSAVPPRPEFGDRPSGTGFRPTFSGRRPGLLRQSGLQDAMQSARNSPLERALRRPPPAVQIGAQLDQAVEALRNVREARRQQFAARATRPRQPRRGRIPPYVAQLTDVPRSEPEVSQIRNRLRTLLNASGYDAANVTLRARGNVTVLEGTVVSARDGRVIEHLLRLEPSIDEVENRLRASEAVEE